MKRVFTVFLTLVFMLSMTAAPVLAKGAKGGGGKGGHKQSISASTNSGQAGNINKGKSTSGKKIMSNNNTASESEYSDTCGHWASKAIKKVKDLGIVNGYQDGTFQPDSPVTATEAVVMMVNMAEVLGTDEGAADESSTDETASEETSTDESTSDEEIVGEEGNDEEIETESAPAWAKESFKQAKALGINLNRFHSQVQASRVDCAVALAQALGINPALNGEVPFTDVGYLSGENLGYLVALHELGVISGTPDGKFNPNSNITRAQIAAMMAEAIAASEQTDATTTDDTTADDTTADDTTTDDTTADDTTADDTTTDDTTTDDTATDDTAADDTATDDTTTDDTTTDDTI